MSQRDGRRETGIIAPGAQQPVHVVLVGLPGVGKSTIGLRLARELRRPFLDSDTALGLDTGHGVRTDAVHDEAECAWFARVAGSAQPAVIVAPAVILSIGVDEPLRQRLWMVFLDAPLATIATRLAQDLDESVNPEPGEVALHADFRESDRRDHERARRLSDFSYVCTNVDPNVAARVIAHRWRRDRST